VRLLKVLPEERESKDGVMHGFQVLPIRLDSIEDIAQSFLVNMCEECGWCNSLPHHTQGKHYQQADSAHCKRELTNMQNLTGYLCQ
jgi:hypothetical protein